MHDNDKPGGLINTPEQLSCDYTIYINVIQGPRKFSRIGFLRRRYSKPGEKGSTLLHDLHLAPTCIGRIELRRLRPRRQRFEVRDAVEARRCFGWPRGAVCCREAARGRRQRNECNCTPHVFSPISPSAATLLRAQARQRRKGHSVPAKARAYHGTPHCASAAKASELAELRH